MDSGPEGNFQHGSGSSHLGHGSSFMPLFINNTHDGSGSSWANTRLNPPAFRQLNSPPKPMSVGHDSATGVFFRLAGGHSIDRERDRGRERAKAFRQLMPQPSTEPCKKAACDIQACLTKNNFIPQRFVLSHLFLYCCLDDFDSYPAYSSQSLLTKKRFQISFKWIGA